MQPLRASLDKKGMAILRISQSSSVNDTSQSDCLMSSPRGLTLLLSVFYPSAQCILLRQPIDKLPIISESDPSDKIKRDFFQAVTVSILLYGYTAWTLTKCIEKKVDAKYSRMPRAALNKFLDTTPSKTEAVQPLASHLTNHQHKTKKTCWSLLKKQRWTNLQHSLMDTCTLRASVGQLAKTCLHHLCVDTWCSQEYLSGATDDRNG